MKLSTFLLVFLLFEQSYLADSILISWDNDAFYGTDRHLTNNLDISYMMDIENSAVDNISFTLTHQIFTPEDIEEIDTTKYDLPYAGYAALDISLYKVYPNYFFSMGLILGVIGEHSYAQEIQTNVHKWIGSPTPQGWDTQVENKKIIGINSLIGYKLPQERLIFDTFEMDSYLAVEISNHTRVMSTGIFFRYANNPIKNFNLIGEPVTSQLSLPKKFADYSWSVSLGASASVHNYWYILENFKRSEDYDENKLALVTISSFDMYYQQSKFSLYLKQLNTKLHGKSLKENWLGLRYVYTF